MSALQALNHEASQGAVVDVLHGVEVADPYRALEVDSELTQRWIEAQTARTERALADHASSVDRERLDALLSIGVIGGASVHGGRIFYTKRESDEEQASLYVREGEAAPRRLLDPTRFGERAALDWYYPSERGRFVAFGISHEGDERSTLRVLDVGSGELLRDEIRHTKWSQVAWLGEEGFYYRRYPAEGEPDYDAEAEDTYHQRVFFHPLGADPSADSLVHAPSGPTRFPSVSVSDEGRFVVINDFDGWSRSEVFLFDRGETVAERAFAPTPERPVRSVVTGRDHLYVGRAHRGQLYLLTNEEAPRYRVMRALAAAASGPESFEVLVPEGEGSVEGMTVAGDALVLSLVEDIAARIRVFGLDGERRGEVSLPGRGELSGFDADAATGRVAYVFSSFVHPPALYEWQAGDGAPREIDRVQTDFDFGSLTLSRASARSRDGTPINIHFVHRADLEPSGEVPVLLTGYGGFNISLLPGFRRNALYLAERGGIFAVANLRGGGELGEAWHRAGNRGEKERVFEDFEAAITYFAESGWSRPERIAITGGSNGGLLMGAMITRCPERFGAVVAHVGLYDMVRYHLFPPAELWVGEYGSPEVPDELAWLLAYSPYHRVRPGLVGPSILITTAERDTRVHWAHSTKFAARLQDSSGEADPEIYFHMARSEGHGAGSRRSDTVDRLFRLFAFLERAGVSATR